MARRLSVLMVAGVLLLVLVAGVALARTFQCNNNPCTGTNNDDVITERQGTVSDEISGLDGADVIRAQKFGNDNDVLDGDQRGDLLRANDRDNRDSLDCGAGNDEAVVDEGDAVNFSNCERVRGQNDEPVEEGPPVENTNLNEAVFAPTG